MIHMGLLDMELSNRTLVEEVIKHHFNFWMSKFPRIKGLVFDKKMDEYTEDDWQWIIDHPEKVYLFWWDTYWDLQIYIHKRTASLDSRPNIDWGYVRYTGHHNPNGYSYTLKKMIKEYESTRC